MGKSTENEKSLKCLLALSVVCVLASLPSLAATGREGCHAWLDVNTNLFASNIRALQEIVGRQTKICAVMKADAYGCGIRTLMPEVINT